MDNIIEPTMDYDFSKLYLGPPSNLTGGAYFTRIMYGSNKQIYIQTPKSLSKQGFVKSGKKIYIDLMFDNNDTVFINWIENLEQRCQELIFSKSQTWFETKLEKDDIETAFTSPFKIFKSGKYYLLRVNVKPSLKVYNEMDEVVKIEDVTADKNMISILEIQGIKFTARNFQLEIELKQSMIVSPDPFLDECFIKKPIKKGGEQKPLPPADLAAFVAETVSEIKADNNVPVNTVYLEDNLEDNLEEVNIDLGIDDIEDPTTKANTLANSGPPLDNEPKVLNIEEPEEHENILLEIEDLDPKQEVENDDENLLQEVDVLDINSKDNDALESSSIQLKKPNQVYYEIYKKAREQAKELKKAALKAYFEMKNIKKTYMLDDVDSSDEEFESFRDEEETN